MPYFVVHCTDYPDVLAKRQQARPLHLARLEQLHHAGRLLAAGPMPIDAQDLSLGFSGSTLIVDFDSRLELDAWLADEPYLHAGVYQHVDVQPFIKVFPKDA
jgi:uncharacterized protein YciI